MARVIPNARLYFETGKTTELSFPSALRPQVKKSPNLQDEWKSHPKLITCQSPTITNITVSQPAAKF